MTVRMTPRSGRFDNIDGKNQLMSLKVVTQGCDDRVTGSDDMAGAGAKIYMELG